MEKNAGVAPVDLRFFAPKRCAQRPTFTFAQAGWCCFDLGSGSRLILNILWIALPYGYRHACLSHHRNHYVDYVVP